MIPQPHHIPHPFDFLKKVHEPFWIQLIQPGQGFSIREDVRDGDPKRQLGTCSVPEAECVLWILEGSNDKVRYYPFRNVHAAHFLLAQSLERPALLINAHGYEAEKNLMGADQGANLKLNAHYWMMQPKFQISQKNGSIDMIMTTRNDKKDGVMEWAQLNTLQTKPSQYWFFREDEANKGKYRIVLADSEEGQEGWYLSAFHTTDKHGDIKDEGVTRVSVVKEKVSYGQAWTIEKSEEKGKFWIKMGVDEKFGQSGWYLVANFVIKTLELHKAPVEMSFAMWDIRTLIKEQCAYSYRTSFHQ